MDKQLKEVMVNLKNMPINAEIYTRGDRAYVYFLTESGSGAEYKVESIQDVADEFSFYLKNYYTEQ